MEEDKTKEHIEEPPEHGDPEENTYEMEAAEEAVMVDGERRTGSGEDAESGSGMAWLGLTAAILSYFLAPYLLAAGGLILGIIGFRKGSPTLGAITIGLAIASLLFTIFFPMMIGMFRMVGG